VIFFNPNLDKLIKFGYKVNKHECFLFYANFKHIKVVSFYLKQNLYYIKKHLYCVMFLITSFDGC
jgi:hypothetical protein